MPIGIAVALWLIAFSASAQTPATGLSNVDASSYGQRVALGPEWLFAPGDDPSYASPSLDDSQWRAVSTQHDLSEYGYRGLHRVWYRMHVHLRPEARGLTLELARVNGSYEVYANGELIGGNGEVGVDTYRVQRRMLDLPLGQNLIGPSGDLVLALRFSLNSNADSGIASPLTPGTEVFLASRDAAVRDERDWNAHQGAEYFVIGLLDLVVGAIALSLWFTMRSHKEYLAAAAYLLVHALDFYIDIQFLLHDRTLILEFAGFSTAALCEVAFIEFIRLTLGYRYTRGFLALESMVFLSILLVPVMHLGFGTYWLDTICFFISLLFVNFVLLVLLVRSGRAGTAHAWLLFPAVVSYGVRRWWEFSTVVAYFLHFTPTERPLPIVPLGSYHVSWGNVPDVFYQATLLFFLISRTIAIARERARSAAEFEAARTVQQVLVATGIPEIPGFRIESAYYPAGDVGGDFFQILPLAGKAFVVIGDVSGKGMPAAMTVSLLVGTVRTLAHFTNSPGEILAVMNQRMMGRNQGGFTTCLVVRIDADGKMVAANAGHLAPYVNGLELQIENGLPLGILPDATYAEAQFTLAPGDRLTLITDGIVEAQNGAGELFGFERTAKLSLEPAETIAQTAQQFGQEDDITVLSLNFTPA